MTSIQKRLFGLQDAPYGDFMARLIPTVPREKVIGIRTPALRALSKELAGEDMSVFMEALPHAYFEEDGLHAFLIEQIRDFDDCLAALKRFLPYIDNWATCDCLNPPVFRKNRERLLPYIQGWLSTGETYPARFGVDMLMKHYLDEAFREEYLAWAAALPSQDYYLRMGVAWYFATALAKQYDAALPYLEEKKLDLWTHNKAIQKAVESRRLSDAQKAYLKGLKRKE